MPNNPDFEALVAATPASFAADFRLRPIPRLSDAVKAGGSLQAIAQAHDMAMQSWAQDAERSINERITQAAPPPLGKPAATTPAASTTTASTQSGGVTSVNGETGVVKLTSDDVPPGTQNLYMTEAGWLSLFDHNGFSRTVIPSGDVVMIPDNRCAVLVGPITIDGTLIINGALEVL